MVRFKKYKFFVLLALVVVFNWHCSRDIDDLEPAKFPAVGEVFIDGFPAGLEYAAFGGSKLTAFQVDTDVRYKGGASMRFEVPDFEDPAGSYAGGVYFTSVGRDLSGFDALTFWARASKAATIDVVGFGNDFDQSPYEVALTNLEVNSNWKKYYIPIPDPSLLTQERGMFFYSEGPEDEKGYTFWIDEVRFEKLGTIAHPRPVIFEGKDEAVISEAGRKITVSGVTLTSNLPNGVDQTINISPAYLSYTSSNPSVATVNNSGVVTILQAGDAVITGKLGDIEAAGSLRLQATGAALLPSSPAPTPTISQDSVISMFSNAYENVVVDTWNPFWEFSTAEVEDVKIGENDVKRYRNLNFVGILTESDKIDASEMTHFHIDIWTPDPTDLPVTFKVLLVDFGANEAFGGGDDTSHELTFTSPVLQTEEWVSLDIPLADFTGLTNRNNIAQLVLSGDIPNVFVDNVFYYNSGEGGGGGGGTAPTEAAPSPAADAADVISLYSNAYQDVPVDTWSAEWDEAEVTDVQVAGNDTKLYTGLNFAGIEFTTETIDASGMNRFHMDIWTPDPTSAPAVFRIKLVDFGANGVFDGGDDVEHEITLSSADLASGSWVSIDVPLSDFAGLTTTGHLAQLIISGDPNRVYVDNVYFYSGEGGGGGGATEPTQAAPGPTQNEANVISLFSDAYTDVAVDTWRTEWSVANFEDVMIDGNPTKKYSNLDFVGIETVANTLDVSSMTHIHLDVWSADYTFFAIKLVDFGADGAFDGGDDVEHQIDFEMPAQGEWVSLDIPLSDFTNLTTRSNLAQYIFVGQPIGGTTIYVDNVYFYQ